MQKKREISMGEIPEETGTALFYGPFAGRPMWEVQIERQRQSLAKSKREVFTSELGWAGEVLK
jgi:hypothetical protein